MQIEALGCSQRAQLVSVTHETAIGPVGNHIWTIIETGYSQK